MGFIGVGTQGGGHLLGGSPMARRSKACASIPPVPIKNNHPGFRDQTQSE